MGIKTTAFAHRVLNTRRGTALTAWTPYAALLTAVTDALAGTVTEIASGKGLTRQAVTFGAPASRATDNTNLIAFGTPSENLPDVVAVGIYDAATVGELREVYMLAVAKVITAGDPVEIVVGALDTAEA